MKRKAFLIGSPLSKENEFYLTGVTPDIQNMKNFLVSLRGGAWNDSEITILENPTKKQLQNGLQGSYDYVILQYSGHGFEYKDKGTYFDINDDEKVSLNTIHSWIDAPKRFYFFDCCRKIQRRQVESTQKSMSTASFNFAADDIRKQYRKKYEKIISNCENGTSIIYSCSLHESASEDQQGKGGAFTCSYFLTAKNSEECEDDEYINIKSIFNGALMYFNKKYYVSDQQHPIILPERRKQYFPFVI
jgi:hypothetical protein